jgi:hypothetical protein
MDDETRKIIVGAVVGTASAITVNRIRRIVEPVAPAWVAWPVGALAGFAAARITEPIRDFLNGGETPE